MIPRTLTPKIIALAQKFQVITLTGPRQSGKTTLVRAAFGDLPYASLEEPDIRQLALTDPRGFLANYPTGAVLALRVGELLHPVPAAALSSQFQ